MPVIFVFVDGVGAGERDPAINPFARRELLLSRFADGGGTPLPPRWARHAGRRVPGRGWAAPVCHRPDHPPDRGERAPRAGEAPARLPQRGSARPAPASVRSGPSPRAAGRQPSPTPTQSPTCKPSGSLARARRSSPSAGAAPRLGDDGGLLGRRGPVQDLGRRAKGRGVTADITGLRARHHGAPLPPRTPRKPRKSCSRWRGRTT